MPKVATKRKPEKDSRVVTQEYEEGVERADLYVEDGKLWIILTSDHSASELRFVPKWMRDKRLSEHQVRLGIPAGRLVMAYAVLKPEIDSIAQVMTPMVTRMNSSSAPDGSDLSVVNVGKSLSLVRGIWRKDVDDALKNRFQGQVAPIERHHFGRDNNRSMIQGWFVTTDDPVAVAKAVKGLGYKVSLKRFDDVDLDNDHAVVATGKSLEGDPLEIGIFKKDNPDYLRQWYADNPGQVSRPGKLPDLIIKEARPMQSQTIEAILGQGSLLVSADTGLGKGLIGIGAAEAFLSPEEDPEYATGEERIESTQDSNPTTLLRPCVIICQAKPKPGQRNEVLKWTEGSRTVLMVEGQKAVDLRGADYIVINYDILSHHCQELIDIRPGVLIIDEIHYLKSNTSNRWAAAFELAESIRSDGGIVAGMSATPMLSRPAELWPTLQVLGLEEIFGEVALEAVQRQSKKYHRQIGSKEFRNAPHEYAFYTYFCNGYVYEMKRPGRNGKVWKQTVWNITGSSNNDLLRHLMWKHAQVRWQKLEVITDLPPCLYETILCDLSPSARSEYKSWSENFEECYIKELKAKAKADKKSSEDVRTEIARFRRIMEGPASSAVRFGKLRQVIGAEKAKHAVEWLKEWIDANEDPDNPRSNKIIVYAHHTEVQRTIRDHPDLKKYNPVAIGADTKDSMASQATFNEDPDCKVVVCSLTGAKEFFTLTAASNILLVEAVTVPGWIKQLVGRCWGRLNDLHGATLHMLVADKTTDVPAARHIRRRVKDIDIVMDGKQVDVYLEGFGEEDESGDDIWQSVEWTEFESNPRKSSSQSDSDLNGQLF